MNLGYCCYNTKILKERKEDKKSNPLFRKGSMSSFLNIKTIEGQRNYVKPLIMYNLESTLRIINWNVVNDVFLYRFTSTMIPFAELMQWEWYKDADIRNMCNKIRNICIKHDIQTSMHPSQHCVINSHKPNVVAKSAKTLSYHYRISQLLGCKLILIHIGSTASNRAGEKKYKNEVNKKEALQRFKDTFNKLLPNIQNMICIENDDKSYTVEETLRLCQELGRPMVADFHHDRCNPSENSFSYYNTKIYETWKNSDLRPKIHVSSGESSDTDRSHAEYVLPCDLKDAIACSGGLFDIMLECKAKEKSLLRLRVDM